MICQMALHAQNALLPPLETEKDVQRFFEAQGYDFEDLVESSRPPESPIPIAENLISSAWKLEGEGARASVTTAAGNTQETTAPGIIISPAYLGRFEDAVASLHRCVESAAAGELLAMATSSLASVETYVRYRAEIYNLERSEHDALVDTKEAKVSFEAKIDNWVPRMTGHRVDKGGKNWKAFRDLRDLRDDVAVHVKASALAMSYKEIATHLNRFRHGIAGLLIDLHQCFKERITCRIIRYRYLPDIVLLDEKAGR